MQNTMQYYERKYELLQDALSSIGGITRLILSVAKIINYIHSRYITLIDSEELFIFQNENNFKETINNKNVLEKQIKKDIGNQNPPKRNRFNNNYQYQNNNILPNDCISKENINYPKLSKEDINRNSSRNNLKIIRKRDQNKYLAYNKNNGFSCNSYFYYERKERNKFKEFKQTNSFIREKSNNLKNDIDDSDKYIKKEDDINDNCDKCNKSEIKFYKFLSYIICCGKNNRKMSSVEELRYKVLSEETIARSYLNLNEINKLSEFIK